MSLQSRLADLITAIGADIKAIPVVRTGMGVPSNATGKVGDFYLDITTGNLYGPKAIRAPAKVTGAVGQLHPNGSLETNTTGWATTAAAGGGVNVNERTQDRASDGSWSYHTKIHRIASTATTMQVFTGQTGLNGIPVNPLLPYSLSMRVYGRVLQNLTGVSGLLRVYWFKADGTASTVDASVVIANGLAIAPVVGQWTEHNFENIIPPSDAAFARAVLQIGTSDAAATSIAEVDVDSVLFVNATESPKWGAPLGKIDVTGLPSEFASGSFNAGTKAAGIQSSTITFDETFSVEPFVMCTIENDGGSFPTAADVVAHTIREVSTTQFKIAFYRVDAAGGAIGFNMWVNWWAWVP